MKTLVLGAGVVGVATAYFLARSGHEVVVVERQPGAGLETSFANGGQVSPCHAEPWANPEVLGNVLKWMGREDAPLIVRWRFDPAMIAWCLRFLANCTASRARINTERTLRVALYSRRTLAELRRETGIAYDQLERGILHLYRDRREFDHACRLAELMTALGVRREPVDPGRCVAIEPALRQARERLVGGIYTPDDESGDAYKFTCELARICAGLGVSFRYGVPVRRLVVEGGRLTGVDTNAGRFTADATVLALGSYSPLLLRPLGIRVPIYPAKGYSVTLPVTTPEAAPTVSLTDDARKIVFSRLGDRLRAAGTAELAGYDLTLRPVRAQAILKGALDWFPDAGDPARAEFWCGLRPVTPDSVPVLGASPVRGLYLNTGHGTLGWTMACGSGRILADLISGRKPEVSLDGLGCDRF